MMIIMYTNLQSRTFILPFEDFPHICSTLNLPFPLTEKTSPSPRIWSGAYIFTQFTDAPSVVFDAYKVPGGQRHIYRYNNLDVIFTKEAETADLYIEQAAHELTRKYDVTVATSDAIEQVIIFGAGAQRLSALNFYERVKAVEREIESLID